MINQPQPPVGPRSNEDLLRVIEGFAAPDTPLSLTQKRERVIAVDEQVEMFAHGDRELNTAHALLSDRYGTTGLPRYLLDAKAAEYAKEELRLRSGETLRDLVDMNGKRGSDTIMLSLAKEVIGYYIDALQQVTVLTKLSNRLGQANPLDRDKEVGETGIIGEWHKDKELHAAVVALLRYHDVDSFENNLGDDMSDVDYESDVQTVRRGKYLLEGALIRELQGSITMLMKTEFNRAYFWSQHLTGIEGDPKKGTRSKAGLIDIQSADIQDALFASFDPSKK